MGDGSFSGVTAQQFFVASASLMLHTRATHCASAMNFRDVSTGKGQQRLQPPPGTTPCTTAAGRHAPSERLCSGPGVLWDVEALPVPPAVLPVRTLNRWA